jgi:putative membrane protein
MSTVSSSSTGENQTWQRLSPIAVIYFSIKFAVQFVKEGLINLAPAFAITLTTVEDKLFWIVIGVVGLFGLLIAYATAYYFNFKFRIFNNEILVNKGVFKKERLTLNFGRVQNVNIATPFYFAPLNLVNCIFDSAGSSRNEISLPGISADDANALRETVFEHKEHQSETIELAAESSADKGSQAPIWTMTNKEAAKFGLTSNMMLILLAALAPFSEFIIDFYTDHIAQFLTGFYTTFTPTVSLAKLLAGGTVVVIIILSMVCFSMLGAWLRYFNYELYQQGNKFKRISGLLERHQMSVSKQRIQAVTIKQSWIAARMQRVLVCFEQIAAQSGPGAKNKKQQFIIPMLPEHQAHQFISLAFDDIDPSEIKFEPIHPAYMRKTLLVNWGIPIVLMTLAAYAAFDFPVYLSLLAFIPAAWLTWLSYRRYGIWSNNQYAAVRSGLFGFKYYVFPLFKGQQVQVTQTILQKRIGICILEIQMAFRRMKIPYVNAKSSQKLANQLLYNIESTNKSWL